MRTGEPADSFGVEMRSPETQAVRLVLREVADDDLPIFFEQQLDAGAQRMAAFSPRDPNDRDAFMTHWGKIRDDASSTIRTIVADGRVAGNILCFTHGGKREVGYWLGREHWGRGVATRALAVFLSLIAERPLYAGVASDNAASMRVLEKCGFVPYVDGRAFSRPRGEEIGERVLILR